MIGGRLIGKRQRRSAHGVYAAGAGGKHPPFGRPAAVPVAGLRQVVAAVLSPVAISNHLRSPVAVVFRKAGVIRSLIRREMRAADRERGGGGREEGHIFFFFLDDL